MFDLSFHNDFFIVIKRVLTIIIKFFNEVFVLLFILSTTDILSTQLKKKNFLFLIIYFF